MRENTVNKNTKTAIRLLKEYKGSRYTFGKNATNATGKYAGEFGSDTFLIVSQKKWANSLREKVNDSLKENSIRVLQTVDTKACAIINPYYTLFFSSAIKEKLIRLADIFKDYLDEDIDINDLKISSQKPFELVRYIALAMNDRFFKRLRFAIQAGTDKRIFK